MPSSAWKTPCIISQVDPASFGDCPRYLSIADDSFRGCSRKDSHVGIPEGVVGEYWSETLARIRFLGAWDGRSSGPTAADCTWAA